MILVKDLVHLDPINENNNVSMKDTLNTRETASMCAGFMTIDNTEYKMQIKNNEIQYVIEGRGEIVVRECVKEIKNGDTVYIPKGCDVLWKTKDKIKIFYVSCPIY